MNTIDLAVRTLKRGGVIAYPTEGVYGLGCDPNNEAAVKRILGLKQRAVEPGLILIAATFESLQSWIKPISKEALKNVLNTWPGPTTWIFPKSNQCPAWVSGAFDTVAVRVTDHPIAAQICAKFGPIVSTSANPHQQPPAKTAEEVKTYFNDKIDLIVIGSVGNLNKPTSIKDASTGLTLRI